MEEPIKEWRKVKDRYVRHAWKTDCDCYKRGHMITVRPTEYGNSGIPVCPVCGNDMVYQFTELRCKVNPTE